MPLIVLGLAYGTAWLLGVGTFAVPADIESPPAYLLDLVVSIVIVTLTLGIGEEIGWRGYMLPHLLKLGAHRAMIVSGLATASSICRRSSARAPITARATP